MSLQNIVDKIIEDANIEAEKIISNASLNAQNIKQKSDEKIAKLNSESAVRAEAVSKTLLDGKVSEARLEGVKILLQKKREIIDNVYDLAFNKLNSLEKVDALELATSLIAKYAKGGEQIIFADDYSYIQNVLELNIVKEKNITYGGVSKKVRGGFMLSSTKCDIDLSYDALLKADRDDNESSVAQQLFKV